MNRHKRPNLTFKILGQLLLFNKIGNLKSSPNRMSTLPRYGSLTPQLILFEFSVLAFQLLSVLAFQLLKEPLCTLRLRTCVPVRGIRIMRSIEQASYSGFLMLGNIFHMKILTDFSKKIGSFRTASLYTSLELI